MRIIIIEYLDSAYGSILCIISFNSHNKPFQLGIDFPQLKDEETEGMLLDVQQGLKCLRSVCLGRHARRFGYSEIFFTSFQLQHFALLGVGDEDWWQGCAWSCGEGSIAAPLWDSPLGDGVLIFTDCFQLLPL